MLGTIVASSGAWAQSPPAPQQRPAQPQPPTEPAEPAEAAPAEAVAAQPATPTELDSVVVVGSRFAGTSETGMLPVTVVTQEEIEDTGASEGEEFLRELPQVGDQMFDHSDTVGNLNAARGDVGSINLRNLGTGNTLLLVNGRRVVPHPGTQTENLVPVQTGNINAIPLFGVSRTEVLMGGASALYGSDAVAGVLNVVMDTHFQGLEVQARYGGSENVDLREGNVNFKAGQWFNDGRTRVTLLGGHTFRNAVPNSAHPWTANLDMRWLLEGTEWEGHPSFDNRVTTRPWGAFQTVDGQQVIRDDGQIMTNATGTFSIHPEAHLCTVEIDTEGVCLHPAGFSTERDRELRLNAADQRNLRGEVSRNNVFGTIEQDIDDNFVAFGEFSYFESSFRSERVQNSSLATAPIIVPASNYWNPFGAMYLPDGSLNPNRLPGIDAPEEGLDLRITSYRAADTYRPYKVNDHAYRVLAGVRGDLWGFDWESAIFYSAASTEDTELSAISNTRFSEALSWSDPTAYNPFNGGDLENWQGVDGTPSDPAALAHITVPVTRRSEATLFQVDTRFIREDLFSMPAGDVGLAFGAEWRRESLVDDRDPRMDGTITYTNPITGAETSDILGASPQTDTEGSRNVASVYAEIAVPLVAPHMEVPLVHALDVQVAGRYERYSDFGSVANPKVSLGWSIVDGLMLRGNWAKSFLAPNIIQLHADGATVSNTRTDYYLCEADLRAGRIESFQQCGRTQSVQADRTGNADLQPETSVAYSAGIVFQPRFLPERAGGLTLTADYWQIKQDGVVGILGEPVQLALDYLMRVQGSADGNPAVTRGEPDADRIALFEGTGLDPVGTISLVEDLYLNRLPRTTRGVDFGLSHRLQTERSGTFNIRLNAARLIERTQDPLDEEEAILAAQEAGIISDGFRLSSAGSLVGINGTPEWRGSASFSWRYNDWRTGTNFRYVGPFEVTGAQLADGTYWQIPSWTTANVFVERRFEDVGNFLDGTRIRLTVRNVTDRDPPLAPRSAGHYGALHNIMGRGYYVTLTKSFD